jgi:hypothetical protein
METIKIFYEPAKSNGDFHIRWNDGRANPKIARTYHANGLQMGEEMAKLIVQAVNERQKLLDSNRELLAALSGLYNEISPRDYPKHSGMTIVWLDKAKAAINNAKELNK